MADFTAENENIHEEDVWLAITTYEEKLEVNPVDCEALQVLASSYGQIGDHTKAKEYFLRLANIVITEQNSITAAVILSDLKNYAEGDETLNDIVAQIDELAQKADEQMVGAKKSALELKAESITFSLASEMAFAWKLVESGDLSQEEYAGVINDLTEMSNQSDGLPISLLHVLETRNIGDLGSYMGKLADTCGTPIIALDSFEATTESVLALPMKFVIARCALVFDFIGGEALVAILNPYDMDIRDEVKFFLGGVNCHFFITSASQFDRRVERMHEIIAELEEAEREREAAVE